MTYQKAFNSSEYKDRLFKVKKRMSEMGFDLIICLNKTPEQTCLGCFIISLGRC